MNYRIIGMAMVAACTRSALFLGSARPSQAAVVQVDVLHPLAEYAPGGGYPVRFRIRISPLWWIHGTDSPHDGMIP